jgi:deazaflavin-dependent oxidoreductase (nitroreductase family)
MTRIAGKLRNAVPTLILRSPAHSVLSGRYVILEFTGRKTGRAYSTPVAYRQHGNRLLISTDSPWWRNVAHGQPVNVQLCGTRRAATSTRVTGADAVQALRELATIPGYPRAAGLTRVHGVVPDTEIESAARRRVVLAIDLAGTR